MWVSVASLDDPAGPQFDPGTVDPVVREFLLFDVFDALSIIPMFDVRVVCVKEFSGWSAGLDELMGRIAGRFRRVESRQQELHEHECSPINGRAHRLRGHENPPVRARRSSR